MANVPGAPSRTGTFAAGGFAPLLRELARRAATGRLVVDAGDSARTFVLQAGRVRNVASELEREKLGSFLVERGLLEPHRMAVTLLRQPEGVLFGDLLVEEGALEAARMHEELRTLGSHILARLLPLAGQWALWTDVPLGQFPAVNWAVPDLLLAAARSAGQLGVALDPGAWVWALADALDGRVPLTPVEAYVLSRVDGTTTVAQLRSLAGLPRDQVDRALGVMVTAGLLELRESRTVPPVEAGRTDPGTGGSEQAATPSQQRECAEVLRYADNIRGWDFYRRLGVSRGATKDQIHRRYRELIGLFHPDRAGEPHLAGLRRELNEVSTCVEEAYRTLVDTDRRDRYDGLLRTMPDVDEERVRQEEQRQRARREVAAANTSRAEHLIRAGDVGMAVQLLEQAVNYDPQPETLLMLARLEMRNPMWEARALERLRRAVTLAPTFTAGWLELAEFWKRRGQAPKQRQCLERILEYDRGHAGARLALKELGRR